MRSRPLLCTGVATAALYVAVMLTLGTPPGAADTGEQVVACVAWFRTHREGVRWAIWIVTVSGPVVGTDVRVAPTAAAGATP